MLKILGVFKNCYYKLYTHFGQIFESMSSEETRAEMKVEASLPEYLLDLAPDRSKRIVLIGTATVCEQEALVSLKWPGRHDSDYSYTNGATLTAVFGDDGALFAVRGRQLKGLLVLPDVLRHGRILMVDGESYEIERPGVYEIERPLQVPSPTPSLQSQSSSPSPTPSLRSRSSSASPTTSLQSRSSSVSPSLVRTLSLSSPVSSPQSCSSTSSISSSAAHSRRRFASQGKLGTRDTVDPSVSFVVYPEMPHDHPLLCPLNDRKTGGMNDTRLKFRVCKLVVLHWQSSDSLCVCVCVCVCAALVDVLGSRTRVVCCLSRCAHPTCMCVLRRCAILDCSFP